jgi:RNA polymerase sigma factor (sigma-70 family)
LDDEAREEWFVQEVLPHERGLRRYLGRFFAQPSDVADVMQDTFARLVVLGPCERGRIRSVRAFLLRTARNVALDRLRRQRIVSLEVIAELDEECVVDESPGAYEEINSRQELALLSRALAGLPDRCRQVLTLRKVFGVSQRDIAERLQISENTVEKHIANGMRLCAKEIFALTQGRARPRASTRGLKEAGDVE